MRSFLIDITTSLKLYCIIFIIPIILSILNILFVGILGVKLRYGFWEYLYIIWVDFFITGKFNDIMAFKYHLGILFIIFICVLINKD